MKDEENKVLETGLSQHQTVDALKQVALLSAQDYPEKFEINMLRCIFCGFCEEVCPEEAIVMSKDYDLTFSNREEAIYGKDKLLVPVNQLQDRIDFLRKYK